MIQVQARFYDQNPPLIPWPNLLLKKGLSCLYKPREIFWKSVLDSLGMEKGDRVLEVGCGQGLFLARIAKQYHIKGLGIDISPASIKFANENYENGNLKYLNASVLKLPFKSRSFGHVFSFDVLEHIEDQVKAVEEMVRVLKPGGKLVIYTLNKNDKFTLDWFWERLGIDIYARALHKRELFVDIDWLKSIIEVQKAKVLYLSLFDAFFTLFLDEVIMVFVSVSRKLGLFSNNLAGGIFLFFADLASRIFYPIGYILDSPWFKKGRSLSFIIVVKK
ncbi:MAG: class I SAM-dependent methyltransferase [bacterium]|nr:class I SAM-dependent methyltransferase [bacterium]